MGVHPDNEGVQEPTLDDLLQRAALPRVVAIGETGLDYYRLNGRSVADMAWQRERFRVHIRAARATGLPLVIHTRSASADTLAVLKDEGQGAVRGVFHCFTETMEVAMAALDLGFHISFSGILTFRNAEALREVARAVPLDALPDRDRQPLPGAHAAPRQDQPAGLGGPCGGPTGGPETRAAGNRGPHHQRQCRGLVRPAAGHQGNRMNRKNSTSSSLLISFWQR